MRAHKTLFSAISFALGMAMVAVALAGCRAVDEAEKPIDWKLSWAPSDSHVDESPLTTQPTYELEMAAGPNGQGPWVVVWSGATTTAHIPALPGHKCFRAVTVENGVRSAPSEPICGTRLADEDGVRYAAKGKKGRG